MKETVYEHGEFVFSAARSWIFSQWAAMSRSGIELFDDEIETLRSSILNHSDLSKKVKSVTLLPANEFPLIWNPASRSYSDGTESFRTAQGKSHLSGYSFRYQTLGY